MCKIREPCWRIKASLLCSVLVCAHLQIISASLRSAAASNARALQNYRMIDHSDSVNLADRHGGMLLEAVDDQFLVKWSTGTRTLHIRDGKFDAQGITDASAGAIPSRKVLQDKKESPDKAPTETPSNDPTTQDEASAPTAPKNAATSPENDDSAAVSPNSTPGEPLELRQDEGTGDPDKVSRPSGPGSSAQGPSSVESDEDEDPKNFGFEFDSGMVTYFLVFAGIALCMCPFAAWQCLSKPPKKSEQFVQPDVEVISI